MLGVEWGNSDEEHKKDDSAGRQRRSKEHVPAHTNIKVKNRLWEILKSLKSNFFLTNGSVKKFCNQSMTCL